MDSYLSRARERRRYLDSVKKLHTLHAVNCTLETCPQWRRCSQVGLQTRLFGQGRADVFFLFDSPGPQEIEEGLPLMGRLGSVFRDAVLRPFVQKTPGISYALGYLVRSIQQEEGKKFLKKEYNSCWHNLMSDLSRHRPRLIVAFGSSVFSFLVSKAINKREIELKIADNPVMTNLRQHLFKLRLLDDYEPELLVAYSPGFVLSNPSATRYLDDDSARIISAAKGKYSPEDPAAKESRIKIDKIEILKTEDQAINFLDQLADGLLFSTQKAVAFDTETLNLNRKFNNAFLSWQFSYAPGHAVVLPMEHPDCPIFENPTAKIRLVQVAQRLFNNPTSKSRIRCFVAHNAKFDLAVLYGSLGIIQRQEDAPYVWCTQNAMHWLDENRKSLARFLEAGDKPYSLKTLGKEFFNFRYRAQHLELRSEGNLSELSIDDLAEYGGSDTILTLALYEHQLLLAQEQPKDALQKLTDFQKYYYSKTNRSLALMECNGLYVSSDHISFLQGSESPIWNRLNEIKHKLLQKSPEVLDFRKKYHHKLCAKTNVTYDDLWGDGDSTVEELVEFDHKKKTHRDAFYLEFLKLEPLEYSQKTKEPSFDSGFLEHYSKPENYKQAFGVRPYLAFYNNPKEDSKGELVYPPNPIQLIAELQKLEKLASGYLVSMQKLLDDKGGDCRDSRVRASFHPTGTDTGRLSSCIAKGTRIEVVRDVGKYPEGIPIEDVKEGDLVYCYDNDPVSPKLTLKKVLWAGQTGHKEVIRLHWIGRRHKGHLDLTPDHLVRLVDGSYKEASTLNPSDQILALNRVTDPDGYSFLYYRGRSSKTYMGYNHRVVKIERLEDPVDVYDLHIEDVNNFIANELCVHNSSPNFQNLPAGRSKAAKEIKNMFQAEPPSKRWPNGTCLIQVDYAAAEVFWAVNFSQEPELVSFLNKCADDLNGAYENGEVLSDEEFEKIILSTDFHKRTASLMFEIPAENVSKQMRQESKAITFGLLYGKTTQGLAADNGWTVEEAEAKMRKFFSAFPRLERWLKEQIATARRHGYVETLMGRRRRLSHFYATKQPKHAGEADRKAMNSPIQGQSSDAGVIGLNNFVEYVLKNNLEKRWLVENVVHDSILFQVPMEDIEAILPVIKTSLTTGMRDYIERHWSIKIPVTLRCDFELGLRYGDLHGWDQRAKTLRPLLEKIASDAKKLWGVGDKNESSVISLRKPSPSLDLVTWQGHP